MGRIRNSISFIFICLAIGITNKISAQQQLGVTETATTGSFPLSAPGFKTMIYVDPADATVTSIAANAFSKDLRSITGIETSVNTGKNFLTDYAIVIGTIGHSPMVDSIIKANKINVQSIRGQWERFIIRVIDQPSKKVKSILVIAGSDRRGTAFGVFELSRKMGVSPFYWWADVTPLKRKQLFVTANYQSASPSVKYRGIFINDEDWGIQPWAAKKMDTAIKDIGPRTYEKVFELLLRLKANYIWPAMHPCTKAFYYYKENPRIADQYAIVVGGSHCEPMLRNNVFEWAENYENEYGKKPGEWRYDLNKEEIYKYWDDRVKESVHYESVYTVGMRGVHDGSMPGPKDPDEKLKLLENVIIDQRKILGIDFNEPAQDIPQIFVPYKEVLSLYRRGLPLADDITIIWPDDNYGYIRQLPNQQEQQRKGGHGVYYHLSYWGAPQDYLWLSSTSPVLISYEMTKAYQDGATKLWVVNVGDIKPAEAETQFYMDLAWNINQWKPGKANEYSYAWAEETFGKKFAREIAYIKDQYYALARQVRPEHMNSVNFFWENEEDRLIRYNKIASLATTIYNTIDPSLKDAFYELILYPVLGAKLMNEKFVFARYNILEYADKDKEFDNGDPKAKGNADRSRMAFDSIATITDIYNKQIAGGKWDGMMSWHPRDQKVFAMPLIVSDTSHLNIDSLVRTLGYKGVPDFSIQASDFTMKKDGSNAKIEIIKGLGVTGDGVTLHFNNTKNTNDSAYIEFNLSDHEGIYEIRVKCLPDFDTEFSKYLRYHIAVDNEKPIEINVYAEAESKEWRENVIRGYSAGKSTHKINEHSKLRIWLKDKNLVINAIEFYHQRAN
ncbi:MAG: glycosyl hydrolase 115 family protein [Chitinophagaceae bacterium]